MEGKILESIAQYGVFALLFAFLLFYVLRTNDSREKRYIEREDIYQDIIKELTQKFCIIDGIKNDVCEIKEKLKGV